MTPVTEEDVDAEWAYKIGRAKPGTPRILKTIVYNIKMRARAVTAQPVSHPTVVRLKALSKTGNIAWPLPWQAWQG